jgi:hypothetical protein
MGKFEWAISDTSKSLYRAMFHVHGFLGPLKWTEIGWVILAVDTDDL